MLHVKCLFMVIKYWGDGKYKLLSSNLNNYIMVCDMSSTCSTIYYVHVSFAIRAQLQLYTVRFCTSWYYQINKYQAN